MVVSADGQFEVWMPSEPKKMNMPLAGASDYTLTSLSSQGMLSASDTYIFSVFQMLEGTKIESFRDGFFRGGTEGIEELGGKDMQVRMIPFAGVTAQESKYNANVNGVTNYSQAVAFIIGNCAYVLQVRSKGQATENDDAKNFFASFRKKMITAPEAAPPVNSP